MSVIFSFEKSGPHCHLCFIMQDCPMLSRGQVNKPIIDSWINQ